jgi:hypothetical protein
MDDMDSMDDMDWEKTKETLPVQRGADSIRVHIVRWPSG